MPSQPLQFLLLLFAGWVNRKQLDAIAYLREENRILREQTNGRRLRFTDEQRRREIRSCGSPKLSEVESVAPNNPAIELDRLLAHDGIERINHNFHRVGYARRNGARVEMPIVAPSDL
jgi:hypothetical protein